MSSPRLVLHPPSLQAPLPAMAAVTPLRNLLRTAGRHTKESLSAFKSTVASGQHKSSLLFSPVAVVPCRALVSLHTIFIICCCFFPRVPRLDTSKSTFWLFVLIKCLFFCFSCFSVFANDQLLALQLFSTAQLVQLWVGGWRGRGWCFLSGVYQTM